MQGDRLVGFLSFLLGNGNLIFVLGPDALDTPTRTAKSATSNLAFDSGLHDAVPFLAAKHFWVLGNKPFGGDVDAFLCTLSQTFPTHTFGHASGHGAQQALVHAGFLQHFLDDAYLEWACDALGQLCRENGVQCSGASTKQSGNARFHLACGLVDVLENFWCSLGVGAEERTCVDSSSPTSKASTCTSGDSTSTQTGDQRSGDVGNLFGNSLKAKTQGTPQPSYVLCATVLRGVVTLDLSLRVSSFTHLALGVLVKPKRTCPHSRKHVTKCRAKLFGPTGNRLGQHLPRGVVPFELGDWGLGWLRHLLRKLRQLLGSGCIPRCVRIF